MISMARYLTWLSGLLVVLLVDPARAQSVRTAGAIITNVRAEVDSQRVKIQYDVVGISPADSVYVQVESRGGGILPVRTVTGDVGRAVSPGADKTIYWDYGLDDISIADDIRATVVVKQASRQRAGSGGATYALLSALAPGVGTIFVQPNRKIGVRPLITVAYTGLLVYGLVQRGQSKKRYTRYENGFDQVDYDEANQQHHQYLVAMRTAAVVWAADVVYTYLRGRKNDKMRSNTNRRVVVSYVNTTPTVGVQFSF